MKKNIYFIIKIIVSLSLIWYLFSKIDLTKILAIVLNAQIGYLSIGITLGLLVFLILILRWAVLLAVFFPKMKYLTLLSCYWVGQFFGLFSPGTLGGDVFRIYKISKSHGNVLAVTITGFADRIIGLFSISMLATIAVIINKFYATLKFPFYWEYVLSLYWIIIFFIVLMAFYYKKVRHLYHFIGYFNLAEVFDKLHKIVRLYNHHRKKLLGALGISLLVNIINIAAIYCVSKSIGINISSLYLCLISSIVSLIAIFPISINGLGVQDGAYVYFLSQAGVPATPALSLSLMLHFIRYIIYLFGGIIFIFGKAK